MGFWNWLYRFLLVAPEPPAPKIEASAPPQPPNSIKLTVLCDAGRSFVGQRHLPVGATVAELLKMVAPMELASGLLVRVNRQQAALGLELQEGDYVSITPLKIRT